MVEDLEAYYLIPGSIVYVVKNDPGTGMSQIQLAGIIRPLWTYTRFLSQRPIADIYGVIETPENSGFIPSTGLGVSQLPGVEPMPMPTPNATPTMQGSSEADTSSVNPGSPNLRTLRTE